MMFNSEETKQVLRRMFGEKNEAKKKQLTKSKKIFKPKM